MNTAVKQEAPELGIAEMDSEHRELARLFGEFVDCIKEGGASERLHEIVQQAIECANLHFEHEEELALRAAYPKIEEERFQHRSLRLRMTTLVGDTVNSTTLDPVTLDNLDQMRALLHAHMEGPDRELAEFLKSAGRS